MSETPKYIWSGSERVGRVTYNKWKSWYQGGKWCCSMLIPCATSKQLTSIVQSMVTLINDNLMGGFMPK